MQYVTVRRVQGWCHLVRKTISQLNMYKYGLKKVVIALVTKKSGHSISYKKKWSQHKHNALCSEDRPKQKVPHQLELLAYYLVLNLEPGTVQPHFLNMNHLECHFPRRTSYTQYQHHPVLLSFFRKKNVKVCSRKICPAKGSTVKLNQTNQKADLEYNQILKYWEKLNGLLSFIKANL